MADVPAARLREAVAGRDTSTLRVRVVAPTVVGALDWLASAEDAAHRRAEVRALDAEWTLQHDAEVEAGAGDADPLQAVEDALRSFPADEIVIAGAHVDPDLDDALFRFGIPVTRLDPPGARRSRLSRGLRSLAGGRGNATPFVLFLTVNIALLLCAVVLSLLALAILWLTGNL
jgi:hypothetical protein